MRGTTHVAAGLVASAVLMPGVAGTVLIVVGSLLPDIDTPTSKISYRTGPLPSLFLEHRGITHSIPFAAVLAYFSPYLALGMLTHMVLDLMNPAGVRAIWPIRKRISLGNIATGGILDHLLGAGMAIAAAIIIVSKLGLL